MKVLNSSELNNYIIPKKTAVALGSFDALHKGHMHIIGKMVAYASENGLTAMVQLVEFPSGVRVNSTEKRMEILESAGVECVVIEEFTEDFRKVSYRDFIKGFLKERYNAAAVFAGENYRFGYMAEGDTHKLEAECGRLGIKTEIASCLEIDGIISSTKIREFIKTGDMEKVTEYMGRRFSVIGTVVHGKALGRTIGFPTANINIPERMVIPREGVYLTEVCADGVSFKGITNLGAKPTVNTEKFNIETYIADFDRDIYGEKIEVRFLKRIRDIIRFASLNELKKQLEEDKMNL